MTKKQRDAANCDAVAEIFDADVLELVWPDDDSQNTLANTDAEHVAVMLLALAGLTEYIHGVSELGLYDGTSHRFVDSDGGNTDRIDIKISEFSKCFKKVKLDPESSLAAVVNLLKQAKSSEAPPHDLQEIGTAIGLKGSDANNLECIKIRLKELVDTEMNSFTPEVLQSFGALLGVKGEVGLESFERKAKEIMEKSITPDELAAVLGIGFTGSCTKESILEYVKAKCKEVPKPSDEEYRNMRKEYDETLDCVVKELGLALTPRTLSSVKARVCRKIQQLKEAAANTSQEDCNQALLLKINNQLGVFGSSIVDETHVVAAVKHTHDLYMRTWKGLQDIGRVVGIRHTGITVADILAEIAAREDLAIARPEDREVIQATEKPSQATVNSAQPNFLQTLMLLELMFGGKKKKKA